MLIESSEQLRELTGSFYANSDFSRIAMTVRSVQEDIADIIGSDVMAALETDAQGGSDSLAVRSCRQAIAYMATLRYYRLNDISHEDMGRKVKIDRDNEARPFEWQLARDDRMHLEEYYRALDRLISALEEDSRFSGSALISRRKPLIIQDSATLASLTGLDDSPWLFVRMLPFLTESQRFVAKNYGEQDLTGLTGPVMEAAQRAVALGAVALMGRRTSLRAMPYGLMKQVESDGGGNSREAAATERLDAYLKHLSGEQHYWLEEMKSLRDEAAGEEPVKHLQMPENDPHNKYMRV